MLALLGAGATAAGSVASTYGQEQGVNALRRMWDDQRQQQAGYNDQIQTKTQALLHDLALNNQLGTPQAAALRGGLDAGAMNAAGAVQRQAARRPARGGAEGAAARGQAQQATLAMALRDNRVQALLAGLMQGRQNSGLIGQQYGLDTGLIRNDAQQALSLLPLREQIAQSHGSTARQLGSMFDAGGQALMAYGMSRPGAGYSNVIPSSGGQAPGGGWAASKTFDQGGGATGAWS